MVLSFVTISYNIICLFLLQFILPSQSNLIFTKLYVLCFLYFFIIIFIFILIIISLIFSNFLNSVRKETKKLENEELDSEDVFKVKTFDNENFILEAVNSDNIQKKMMIVQYQITNNLNVYSWSKIKSNY
jgi:hypothetical protein